MRSYKVALSAIVATTVVAAGLAFVPTPASANLNLFYSSKAYRAVLEVNDSLNQIGWPTEASYNYYQPVVGASTVIWGTPGTPTTYEAKAQCAPLVTAGLKRAYGWADDTYFNSNLGSVSPNSARYFDELTTDTLPHFAKRTKLSQLVSGDVIAIKYESDGSATGDPSGHMAFYVSREAVDKDDNPLTTEWAVTVVDSTSNPHGVANSNANSVYWNFPDTRAVPATVEAPNAVEYDGLGRGTMIFQTDVLGYVVGYWWGINENLVSEWHSVADRPVVFGHITEAA